jgi:four helix bundle protein
MVARRFEDLIAWQVAHELQREVFAFIARSEVSRDFKFCDQIRESTRSTTRNIAEGFGRYYPKEFARFLRIATGSLHETKNHLHEALDRKYLNQSEHDRLIRLLLRANQAAVRLHAYLQDCSNTP